MPSFDDAIVSHLANYRLSTKAALCRVLGVSESELSLAIETLKLRNLVGEAELCPGKRYFFLQLAASPERPKAAGPVNGQNKVTAYATLQFCTMGDVYRPKIALDVFRARFPELYRDGPRVNFYTEGAKLGLIRVESVASVSGRVNRLIESVRREIEKRTSPTNACGKAFTELHAEGRFVVAVLTATENRRRRIIQDLNRMRERWHQGKNKPNSPPPPPAMEVHVVPGLLELLFPGKEVEEQRVEPIDSSLIGARKPPHLLGEVSREVLAFDVAERAKLLR